MGTLYNISILFLLLYINSILAVDDEVILSEGIIFHAGREISVANLNYHIVVQLNITSLNDGYRNMRGSYDELDLVMQQTVNISKQFPMVFSKYDRMAKSLLSNIENYHSDLEKFFKLFSQTRQRRAWIEAGGSILHTVFGTLDHESLKKIEKKIRNNQDVEDEKIKKIIIMEKGLESNIKKGINNVNTIAEKLMTTLKNVSEFENQDIKEIFQKMDDVQVEINEGNLLTELYFEVERAHDTLKRFVQAVKYAFEGKLNEDLIGGDYFFELLNKVKKQIDKQNRMIWPLQYNNLLKYYNIINVKIALSEETIFVIMDIPVASVNQNFIQYSVETIPIYYKEMNQFVTRDIKKYFYISIDQSSYFVSDSQIKCQNEIFGICTYFGGIFNIKYNTCESKLFIDQSGDNCRKLIVENFNQQILRVDNMILYSFKDAHIIKINCKNIQGEMIHKEVTVIKSGFINNTKACIIGTENLVMLPSLNYDIKVQKQLDSLDITRFEKQNIKHITHQFHGVDLSQVESVIGKNIYNSNTNITSYVDVSHALQEITTHTKLKIDHWVTRGSLAALIFIIIIVLSCAIYCARLKIKSWVNRDLNLSSDTFRVRRPRIIEVEETGL